MEVLKIACLMFLSLAAFIGLVYFISFMMKKSRIKTAGEKRLSAGRLVHEHLLSEFFSKNIFSSYYFPYPKNKNGIIGKYLKVDSLIVTRGGIAVMSITDRAGRIDNRGADIWVQCHNDKNIEFESPHKRNEESKQVITNLLRSNRIHNIPIYSIVVFTDKNTVFIEECDSVVHIPEMMEIIRQLSRERMLTMSEMFAIRQLLDVSKRTRKQVEEHMVKVYGKED